MHSPISIDGRNVVTSPAKVYECLECIFNIFKSIKLCNEILLDKISISIFNDNTKKINLYNSTMNIRTIEIYKCVQCIYLYR